MREYRIDKRNRTVVLTFDFDKEVVGTIRSSSRDAHWNSELKHWVVPIDSWSKPRVLELIKKYSFSPNEGIPEAMVKFDYSVKPEAMVKLEKICTNKGFTYNPRNYQLESLYYALSKQSFINGDDVGLGKTFEAIIYAEATNSFPCVVIVPASVKYNWAEKWAEIVGPKRTISVIESAETKKYQRDWTADVVIINYDIIGKKAGTGATTKYEELMTTPWKMFIFDEGHFLKEDSSQRSKAARKMTKKSNAIIQLLTGTATMSKPAELWNLLVLIKKEKLIANDWHQFLLRYCGGFRGKFGWEYNGATNTIELNRKLRENCYLRREKRDVLTELPDVEQVIFHVPVTNQPEINKATENLIEYLRETKGEEAADRAMEAESLVSLGVLRRLAIDGKLKAIEQFLKDWKVGGKKLLIFGLHREPLDYLSEKFNSKLIAGGITAKRKQELVKEWVSNDEVFLFANMQSAGTGVDGLQAVCSNMLIIELPWRPSDLTQVIARIDRSGQGDPMTVRFMLNNDTIDRDMWEMLEEKEEATEAVNKGIDVLVNNTGMRSVLTKILKRNKKKK